MHEAHPEIFPIAETQINRHHLERFLDHVGASDWKTDAPTDIEELIEVLGRTCYKSFNTELNPNITRIREGSKKYLTNILKSGHGSVLEHGSITFMLCDVSRVFTHELVRHRAGTAISQESLRFVRLEDIGMWAPTVIKEDEKAMSIFLESVKRSEQSYQELSDHLIDETMGFSEKKKITSALRRLAPDGLATTIGWTANIRTLRHVIEMRTDPGAEEEIRRVFSAIAGWAFITYPHLFGDYEVELVDGIPWYKTCHPKV